MLRFDVNIFDRRWSFVGRSVVLVIVIEATLRASCGAADNFLPALKNVNRFSERIISGSEPRTEAAFRDLSRAGVRTVISVDGAAPAVELSRSLKLRYVHIPFGYDGIPRQAQMSLVRAVRDTEGPIYVHCHHGRHRGPAAAAIACLVEGTADRQRSLRILEIAGTSRDYAGLWRDVADFVPPDDDVSLPALTESAPVPPISRTMASINRCVEQLKLPPHRRSDNHSDAALAISLRELFREAARNVSGDRDEGYEVMMRRSEVIATKLYDAAKTHDAVGLHFTALQQSCVQCHQSYRD